MQTKLLKAAGWICVGQDQWRAPGGWTHEFAEAWALYDSRFLVQHYA